MTEQDPSRPAEAGSSAPPGNSRRGFLGALASSAGLAAAGLHLGSRSAAAAPSAALSGPARALPPTLWDLEAVQTSYLFAEGTDLPLFRYQNAGAGQTKGTLPFFEATEGTAVQIQIENLLPVPFQPGVLGVKDGPYLRPGVTGSIQFIMPPAGSYLLGEGSYMRLSKRPGRVGFYPRRPTNGLAAMIVSRPSSGLMELYNGGPTFDREYVLLFEDADDRVNNLLDDTTTISTAPYQPNFFTINGLAGPDLLTDADTRVVGLSGERILLRMGNRGRMRQSIHFHGYHPEIAARDNVPEAVLPPKDTIPLPGGKTVDAVLVANQTGVYPIHPHNLVTTTATGFYPLGQLTFIEIT